MKKKIISKKQSTSKKKTSLKKSPIKKTSIIKKKTPAKKSVIKKTSTPKKPEKKISDKAVHAKTGKTFQEWFSVLDTATAGSEKMAHKEIVEMISENFPKVGSWWSQMITVSYEQARGTRDKHEKPSGFQISVSKVINVPLEVLFHAWSEDKTRGQWLNETLYIRKAKLNKALRYDWFDGTPIEVTFSSKGKDKTQVEVQHGKLANAQLAEKMKSYWSAALEKLARVIKII